MKHRMTKKKRINKFIFKETNFSIDPETKEIIFEGDKYAPVVRFTERAPKITGLPKISQRKEIRIVKKSQLERKRYYGKFKTPKECDIYYLINFPFTVIGAPQITATGRYRYGKSNTINLLAAAWIARKKRILLFDDDSFEARTLAYHGFFNKHSIFKPFLIVVWIPEGYKFDVDAENHNPLWNHRKNVILKEFKDISEIVDNMEKLYVVNVVYTQAFTRAGLIRLWIDLMYLMRRKVSIHKHFVFMHHELSDMIPENPHKEVYKLIDEMFWIIKRMGKWRIALLTAFHDFSDVKYTIGRKFLFILQKRSVGKSSMSKVEYASRKYSRSQVAVAISPENYREHKIELFPELEESYKLIPSRQLIDYPEKALIDESVKEVQPITLQKILTEIEYQRYYNYVELGKTQQQIAIEADVTQQTVAKQLKSSFKKINSHIQTTIS